MELKIYNSTGTLKLTASPNSTSTVTREVMGEYAVSAAFTHTDFVQLDVNDYVLVEGVKYKLKTPYKPVKKNTQTFIYQVKFYAPIHDAEDALFLYEADGDTTTEFSYDGGPREHLQLWVDNMNRIAGAVLWSIGTVIAGDNKTIDYRNVYCWEAAFGSNGIAATFETELWADGYVVNLCKASRGEIVELGYQKGLTQLQPEENGEMRFFTRLFPLGSTRNIDPTKYGASRLQLPSREKFVDRNVELYGIKEAWEEDAFKDIYPKYVGSVTSVRSEQLTNKEGREYTVYYFKDSGMTFNPNEYEIPEYTKMLAFQTGDLAGRGNEEGSFEANWHADTLEWEIINLYPDEETQLPGGVIIPQPGDTYIPWNFRMPDEYNTAAEEAYRQAVDNFLVSYSFDPTKYTAPTDRHYIERNAVPLMVGQNVRLLSDEYFTGGYKDTRITKVVQKLNDLCQATLTCTDKIGTGWKTSVDNELSSLQYKLARQAEQAVTDIIKTTDTKTASDWNVFSALLSLMKFHRKDKTDANPYLQKFLGGLEVGEFNQGSTGVGIYKDETGNWHIETDYLDVRLKFTATTVEIQKAYHIGGEQIKSAAAMKCVRVEELADAYRCYMNTTDDEGNQVSNDFRVNDQAYVNTFNLVKQADGKTGNHFLWRLVTAVGTNYIDLSKTVCAEQSDAPLSGDDIVLLGYQGTDAPDRQVAVIDAGAGSGAPYYRQFVGINSFSLPAPETQLKPGDNRLSGVLHIENGSTGAGNLSDLPEEVQKAAEFAVKVGGVNLLLNSGFTGNYETEQLEADTMLEEESELYSKALLHWSGISTVQEDIESASGRAVILGEISQQVTLIEGEHYVISYKAKGIEIAVSCGEFGVTQPLTDSYQRYSHKFVYSGSGTVKLSGESVTLCEPQLERGTIATDWSQSPQDNDKAMAEFLKLKHLSDAIKDGSVDFIGGLQLTNVIQVGNYKDGKMQQVTGGLSGIYNDGNDVLIWGDGSMDKAIYTVMKYAENPKYEASEEELKNMANIVMTHGGMAILNKAIIRGYIYAQGGFFKGAIEQAGGFNRMNEDGSVSFANGKIKWGVDGKPVIEGKVTTAVGGRRIEISAEDNRIIMYNDDEKEVGRIDFVESSYNGTIITIPRMILKNVVTKNGVSSEVHTITISTGSITIDQVYSDGKYSVLLDPSGLEFRKDGVMTKKYNNV